MKSDHRNGIKAYRTSLFAKLSRREILLIARICCGANLLFSPAATSLAQVTEMPHEPRAGTRNDSQDVIGAVDDVMAFGRALSVQEINVLYLGWPPVNLSIGFAGRIAILTWSGGMLQAAGDVARPHANVVSASSPYTNAPNALKELLRVRAK